MSKEVERTGCDWSEAYDATGDAAYERMRDVYADHVDMIRQRRKDAGL